MAALQHSLALCRRPSGFLLPGFFFFVSAGPAPAAEPYVTDDARVVGRGSCKLETGRRVQPDGRELWIRPACNVFLNTELTFGHTVSTPDDERRETANSVQVKGLWRELDRHGYGLGWSVLSEFRRHPAVGERRAKEHAATLIASYPLFSDKLTLHANVGGRRERDDGRTVLTGAFLAELEVFERLSLLAELYGSSHARRGYQAGVRVAVVPEHVNLHVTYGGDERDRRGVRYWSLGFELVSPKFMQ